MDEHNLSISHGTTTFNPPLYEMEAGW